MQPKRCNGLVTLGRPLAHADNQSGYEGGYGIARPFHNDSLGEIVPVVQENLPYPQTGFITFHLDQIAQVGQQFR